MPQIIRNSGFATQDIVTAAKLHNLVDTATLGPQAITSLTQIPSEQTASEDFLLGLDSSITELRKFSVSDILKSKLNFRLNTGSIGLQDPSLYSSNGIDVALLIHSPLVITRPTLNEEGNDISEFGGRTQSIFLGQSLFYQASNNFTLYINDNISAGSGVAHTFASVDGDEESSIMPIGECRIIDLHPTKQFNIGLNGGTNGFMCFSQIGDINLGYFEDGSSDPIHPDAYGRDKLNDFICKFGKPLGAGSPYGSSAPIWYDFEANANVTFKAKPRFVQDEIYLGAAKEDPEEEVVFNIADAIEKVNSPKSVLRKVRYITPAEWTADFNLFETANFITVPEGETWIYTVEFSAYASTSSNTNTEPSFDIEGYIGDVLKISHTITTPPRGRKTDAQVSCVLTSADTPTLKKFKFKKIGSSHGSGLSETCCVTITLYRETAEETAIKELLM